MPSRRVPYVIAALVIGCGLWWLNARSAPAPEVSAPQPRGPTAADLALEKTPMPRTYRFDANEMLVIDVPVKELLRVPTTQRCFVWRDAEFKSATVSCPQPPEIALPPVPPESDMERR